MLRGLWSCLSPLRSKLLRSISQCTKQKIMMIVIINCVAYAWICQNNSNRSGMQKGYSLNGGLLENVIFSP